MDNLLAETDRHDGARTARRRVVADVLLARFKGHNSGWIVITVGWGVAVALPSMPSGVSAARTSIRR